MAFSRKEIPVDCQHRRSILIQEPSGKKEKDQIKELEIELFLPFISRGNLVAYWL